MITYNIWIFYNTNKETNTYLTNYLGQYVDTVSHAPFLAPRNPLDYCQQRIATHPPGLSEIAI